MDLYSEIMNIQICDKEVEELFTQEAYAGYKLGKREMRSDAAELALKADARIEELEDVLSKFVNWTTNEVGTISLGDDVELWELAEKVLENK